MLIHVALYQFQEAASRMQIETCMREIETATHLTGLADWYIAGEHLALPADEPIREMVYDFAALWSFSNQQVLDEFSRHPLMQACVEKHIRPILYKLAIANFQHSGAFPGASLLIGEHTHVS